MNWLTLLIGWLSSLVNVPNPAPDVPLEAPIMPRDASKPPIHTIPLLDVFCEAIKSREGFFAPCKQYPNGTPSFRNNNPGNARFSSVGYLPIYGKVGRSGTGFAIFKDYATGWLYLQNMVKYKIEQHPNKTIQDFFNSYAPVADKNDPISYAKEVASKLGVNKDTFQIKGLL